MAEVLAFPPARRAHFVRTVAADIAAMTTPQREEYWHDTCDGIAVPLLRAGVAPAHVRHAIEDFRDCVAEALSGLQHRGGRK